MQYDICPDSMEIISGEISEDTGAISISSSDGTVSHLCHGPRIKLKKGTYYVTIHYMASESGNLFFLYDENAEYDDILSDDMSLDRNHSLLTTAITVTDNVETLEFRVIYMGEGSLTVSGFTIQQNKYSYLWTFLYSILFIIIVQACYYITYLTKFKKKISISSRNVALYILAICVLTSYPLFTDYLFDGHDLNYHLLRIEGLKDALMSGQIPSRIQPTWLGESGFASSIFYGELFLYFPALLRIFGVPVQITLKIFLVLMNIASCLISYYSFKKITKNKRAALLGTLLYNASGYRLTSLYVRVAIGEFSAITFLPLIVYGMYKILHAREDMESKSEIGQNKNKKDRFIWLPLMFGMTGIIQTHVLACEYAIFFLSITCIICIKRLFQKKRIVELLKAAVVTVLINLWFLVPFLDFFRDPFQVTTVNSSVDIQKSGTFLAQLFSLFPQFTVYSMSEYAKDGILTEMPQYIGLAIGSGCLIMIAVIMNNKWREKAVDKLGTYLLVLGIISVLFSTHFFPWNKICAKSAILKQLVFTVQFPWRFLLPATLFLIFAAVIGVNHYLSKQDRTMGTLMLVTIGILTVVSTVYFNDQMLSTSDAYRIYTKEGIDTNIEGSEVCFLPNGSDSSLYVEQYEPYCEGTMTVETLERKGLNIEVHVDNQETVTSLLVIPNVYYRGYEAIGLNDGIKLVLYETDNYMLGVDIPAGYTGDIRISYNGMWYWRISDIISLSTVIGFLVYLFYNKKRNTKIDTTETMLK